MRCIPKKDFIVDVITLNRVCLKVRKKSINGLTVRSVHSKNQMLLPDPGVDLKKNISEHVRRLYLIYDIIYVDELHKL